METTQNLLSTELQIDATAHSHLAETAKWGNFLSIVGFVLSGILGIAALFAGSFINRIQQNSYSSYNATAIGAGFITIVYLIIAIVYFFMSLFLYCLVLK